MIDANCYVDDFLNYLLANNNEAFLELDHYYHLVEIKGFDIYVNQKKKTLRIHNVFYTIPDRFFEDRIHMAIPK